MRFANDQVCEIDCLEPLQSPMLVLMALMVVPGDLPLLVATASSPVRGKKSINKMQLLFAVLSAWIGTYPISFFP